MLIFETIIIFIYVAYIYQVNSKTFHGAGMVVPVDENEIGYREVPETQGRSILAFLDDYGYLKYGA